MNLNLFYDDVSIKLAIDRGEIDEIYNTLKDLINGEIVKPTPNNNNIRYYKDQINIIEDYFFKINNRIDMSKEDRNIDKRPQFLKEINKTKETFDMSKEDRNIDKRPPKKTIKPTKSTTPRPTKSTTPRPTKSTTPRPKPTISIQKKGRPRKNIEGLSDNDQLIKQKI